MNNITNRAGQIPDRSQKSIKGKVLAKGHNSRQGTQLQAREGPRRPAGASFNGDYTY